MPPLPGIRNILPTTPRTNALSDGRPDPPSERSGTIIYGLRGDRNARNASSPLNNLFRDTTFVYGNSRVIYGAGFRTRGAFKGAAPGTGT